MLMGSVAFPLNRGDRVCLVAIAAILGKVWRFSAEVSDEAQVILPEEGLAWLSRRLATPLSVGFGNEEFTITELHNRMPRLPD